MRRWVPSRIFERLKRAIGVAAESLCTVLRSGFYDVRRT